MQNWKEFFISGSIISSSYIFMPRSCTFPFSHTSFNNDLCLQIHKDDSLPSFPAFNSSILPLQLSFPIKALSVHSHLHLCRRPFPKSPTLLHPTLHWKMSPKKLPPSPHQTGTPHDPSPEDPPIHKISPSHHWILLCPTLVLFTEHVTKPLLLIVMCTWCPPGISL